MWLYGCEPGLYLIPCVSIFIQNKGEMEDISANDSISTPSTLQPPSRVTRAHGTVSLHLYGDFFPTPKPPSFSGQIPMIEILAYLRILYDENILRQFVAPAV